MTGGDLGIGYEVSKALALSRARVLILSRKEEHGEDAMKSIKEVNFFRFAMLCHQLISCQLNPSADLEFIPIDLGNLADVRRTADKIREKEKRLDIVSLPPAVHLVQQDLMWILCSSSPMLASV